MVDCHLGDGEVWPGGGGGGGGKLSMLSHKSAFFPDSSDGLRGAYIAHADKTDSRPSLVEQMVCKMKAPGSILNS